MNKYNNDNDNDSEIIKNNQITKVPLTPSKQKSGQQFQNIPQQLNLNQSTSTTAITTTTATTTTSTPIQQQQLKDQQPQQLLQQTPTNTLQIQQQQQKEQQKKKQLQEQQINLLIQSGPPQLAPPALFGTIEPQLYRTNSLYPANFPFIKLLGLKTVVQLSPEVPIKAVSSFFSENNINLIHLGLKSWKVDSSWKPLTDELIKECLEIVLNYDYYPLMITCTSGVHQTGVLVGCLRRLQNWNLTSILVEYKAFSGQSNTRYVNEQFIELFDVDLVTLPNRLPTWFIDQQRMLEEELEEFENSNSTSNSLNSSTNSNSNSNNNNIKNSTDKVSSSLVNDNETTNSNNSSPTQQIQNNK